MNILLLLLLLLLPLSRFSRVQLCDPIVGSPPGSSIHGIFQARVLQWVPRYILSSHGWPSGHSHDTAVISSVQFSLSVVSDSLQPHGLQHVTLPCPSPSPGACSSPLSLWCHPTISTSVIPFSSRLQSFPTSGSFQMSQFFAPGGQSIGVSASASVLPMNIQDWFPLGLTGWISLKSKGLSRVFCNTSVQKYQFFGAQLSI